MCIRDRDGGLVVVLPTRGALRHLVVLRRQLHHCESERGNAYGEMSAQAVEAGTGACPRGLFWQILKKSGIQAGSGGSGEVWAGTHAGASTRRRSGTRICTDENVCPSRRTGCSRAGNPRPCRCRPRRPTSSRCVYFLPHRAKIARSPTPGRCVLPRPAVSSRALPSRGFSNPRKRCALRAARSPPRPLKLTKD